MNRWWSEYGRPVAGWLWRYRYRWIIGGAVITGLALAPVAYANISTGHIRYNANDTALDRIPERPVTIVFGAGVLNDGTLTDYLRERVDTAVALYKAGRSQTLLMSGDNSTAHYNEPERMAAYAEAHGVPKQAIVLDYAGFSTYDTCYRAARLFKVRQALLVTQGYHLPRATMTCRGLGIDSVGVSVRHNQRDWTVSYLAREVLSTDKAAYQIIVQPQPTVSGPPSPIPATRLT